MRFKPVSNIITCIFGNYFIFVEIRVVYHTVKPDAVVFYGVEGQQGVVYRTESAVGDEHDGEVMLLDVVDGEIVALERHHESAGALYEHGGIFAGEFVGRLRDEAQIDLAAVDARRQFGAAWIGEDLGRGDVEQVGRHWVDAHHLAVHENVLAEVIVAGLYEFHGHRAAPVGRNEIREPSRGVALAGVCVYAGDEKPRRPLLGILVFHVEGLMKKPGP